MSGNRYHPLIYAVLVAVVVGAPRIAAVQTATQTSPLQITGDVRTPLSLTPADLRPCLGPEWRSKTKMARR